MESKNIPWRNKIYNSLFTSVMNEFAKLGYFLFLLIKYLKAESSYVINSKESMGNEDANT